MTIMELMEFIAVSFRTSRRNVELMIDPSTGDEAHVAHFGSPEGANRFEIHFIDRCVINNIEFESY